MGQMGNCSKKKYYWRKLGAFPTHHSISLAGLLPREWKPSFSCGEQSRSYSTMALQDQVFLPRVCSWLGQRLWSLALLPPHAMSGRFLWLIFTVRWRKGTPVGRSSLRTVSLGSVCEILENTHIDLCPPVTGTELLKLLKFPKWWAQQNFSLLS